MEYRTPVFPEIYFEFEMLLSEFALKCFICNLNKIIILCVCVKMCLNIDIQRKIIMKFPGIINIAVNVMFTKFIINHFP